MAPIRSSGAGQPRSGEPAAPHGVLTVDQPSMRYGEQTIAGIALRVLDTRGSLTRPRRP